MGDAGAWTTVDSNIHKICYVGYPPVIIRSLTPG